MLEKEKIISTQCIFDGRVVRLRVDTVRVAGNDNIAKREIVEHPGGVGIVALTDDKKVCLVRQYRNPFDEIILEIPAGKLEYGEDSLECAKRELAEETGYRAANYEYLGSIYPTPGYCGEKIHIYLATDLTMGETNPDEDEFVEPVYYTLDELYKMIEKNEISDAKTIVGILKTKLLLENR